MIKVEFKNKPQDMVLRLRIGNIKSILNGSSYCTISSVYDDAAIMIPANKVRDLLLTELSDAEIALHKLEKKVKRYDYKN